MWCIDPYIVHVGYAVRVKHAYMKAKRSTRTTCFTVCEAKRTCPPLRPPLSARYISSGCVGLFACCQSSEMFYLSPDERLQLAKHVVETAAGRVAVVASGTFGGSVEDQVRTATEEARARAHTYCAHTHTVHTHTPGHTPHTHCTHKTVHTILYAL